MVNNWIVDVPGGTVVRRDSRYCLSASPSLGIVVYEPMENVGYFANMIGAVSVQEDRASFTCNPLMGRLSKDSMGAEGLYAILCGDSILPFEYDGTLGDDGYDCLGAAEMDHVAYRKELADFMSSYGFAFLLCYFARPGNEQEVMFEIRSGDVMIDEYESDSRRLSRQILVQNRFRLIDIR